MRGKTAINNMVLKLLNSGNTTPWLREVADIADGKR